jgi:outer membrane protein TolC
MFRIKRTRTATALAIAIVAACAGANAADEIAPAGPPADAFIEGLIRALETPTAEPRALTLTEAIGSAVRNNPGLLAGARIAESATYDVLEAGGVYDPIIRIEGTASETSRLTSSRTETGLEAVTLEEIDESQVTADLGISKVLRTGAAIDLAWTNRRRTTNAAFQILSPSYDPTLGVTLAQPLLRNFGGIFERTTVLLARNTSRQAAAEFEARLADFVADIADGYWNYTQAEADLEVRRHALRLARELVEETEARVDIGTLPPVAAREARADAAAREEEVIRAENDLDLAARTLQYRVMFGAEGGGAPLPIRPGETHEVRDLGLERDKLLRSAVERRPEVRSARLALANAELVKKQERNARLPALDFVGSYEALGLGGKPVDDDEVNSYAEALERLGSGDFFRYSLGLRLEVPLSNATARARYTKAMIDVRRRQDEVRQIVADVALEIERAAGDVASARKRIEAARVAGELARENLANQKKRYEVGMVTTTDVLEFQDRVISAMAAEAEALADHARASARLRRAEGTLLTEYDVIVGYEDAPELPWWGKF